MPVVFGKNQVVLGEKVHPFWGAGWERLHCLPFPPVHRDVACVYQRTRQSSAMCRGECGNLIRLERKWLARFRSVSPSTPLGSEILFLRLCGTPGARTDAMND